MPEDSDADCNNGRCPTCWDQKGTKMLKLLKWIYQLGYQRGYMDGRPKNYDIKRRPDDTEFINEIDQIMENELETNKND